MKNIINLILITSIFLVAQHASAQTVSNDKIKSVISQQVINDYKKYTDAKLNVKVLTLPFDGLSLSEGRVSYKVSSNFDKYLQKDFKKINVYVNGKLEKSFTAPVQVTAYKEVLVASGFVTRESIINENNTKTKLLDISDKVEYVLDKRMIEKEIITNKAFKDGEILDKRFVKMKPDVQRNTQVQAYFNSNNLLISIDAIALKDGMIGDYISLENKRYKKQYVGKVVGTNKVLIKI